MLHIGSLRFSSPLVLAPLAGYSDLPFRLLCRRFGAGFAVSEMISCHGLSYRQPATERMLQSVNEERPVSFQLFGAEPAVMADAAEIIANRSPEMIDLNMGCPVKKVTKRGAGAALMTTPRLAEAIISGIVARVKVPVTVKFRSGPDRGNINAVEFARMAEAAGAAALTVHARTWAQGFSGSADPEVIAAVKAAVKIPVIGNGDIDSMAKARQLMAETGCDGVMIGRAAIGNPWVFQDASRPNNTAAIAEVAEHHLRLIEQFLPADRLLGSIKNQLSRYFKGLPGSSELRQQLFVAPSLPALKRLLRSTCGDGTAVVE
jgi:nifR3 family TIM-barrel protein